MFDADLCDDDLFGDASSSALKGKLVAQDTPAVAEAVEKTAALRGVNPVAKVERWKVKTDQGWKPVPLAAEKDQITLDANFAEYVEKVLRSEEKPINDGFSIAPAVLLFTSLFGPFNGRRRRQGASECLPGEKPKKNPKEHVKDVLLGEFNDFRLYYTGYLLDPLHLNLFALLLRAYVLGLHLNGEEFLRNPENDRVTIDLDAVILALYGQARSRVGQLGGRAPHYKETVSEMLEELRLAALKIVEQGDDKGSPWKGKGYIANFISYLSWDEPAGTVTYSIDRRIANIFALKRHIYVCYAERCDNWKWDEVAIDLQNKFRTLAKKEKKGCNEKEVRLKLGHLKLMMGGNKWSFRPFVQRLVQGASYIDPQVVSACAITGYSIDDEIVMVSTENCEAPSRFSEVNLIGRSESEAKAIIEKTDGCKKQETQRARARQDAAEKLAAVGVTLRKPTPSTEAPAKKRPSRKQVKMPADLRAMIEEGKTKYGSKFLDCVSQYFEKYKYYIEVEFPRLSKKENWSEGWKELRYGQIEGLFRDVVRHHLDKLNAEHRERTAQAVAKIFQSASEGEYPF
jgi:hypothetical protein